MDWPSTYFELEKIPWLTTDWVLALFSDQLAAARSINERNTAKGKEKGWYQQEYHQGSDTDSRILGNGRFIDRVPGPKRSMPKSKIGLEEIWREVCKFKKQRVIKAGRSTAERGTALPGWGEARFTKDVGLVVMAPAEPVGQGRGSVI